MRPIAPVERGLYWAVRGQHGLWVLETATPSIDFVDPFVRKGYRFAGRANVVERGASAFDALLGHFRGALAARMRAIVTIAV